MVVQLKFVNQQNEIKILKLLRSSHVPKLFSVVFDKKRIYMVQQRAGKRTLKNFFKKYKRQIKVNKAQKPTLQN